MDNELPGLAPYNKRQFIKCKKCGRVSFYDYLPFSLSSPVMVPPCQHRIDDYADISEEQAMCELFPISVDEFIDIMNDEDLVGSEIMTVADNVLAGLDIVRKYMPDKNLITGASHDVIYSVSMVELIAAGIKKEDVRKLSALNWMVEEDSYLACFV